MTPRAPISSSASHIELISNLISCEIMAGIIRGLTGTPLTEEQKITAIALGIERAVRAINDAIAPELRWALVRRLAEGRPVFRGLDAAASLKHNDN